MASVDVPPEALREHIQVLQRQIAMCLGYPDYDQKRRDLEQQVKEVEDQLMDSSGQGSSGSGGSSPWYGNAPAGPAGYRGRKRDREDSVDLQYLGIRGEPEVKSQKTTPSPISNARQLLMVEGPRSPYNRELPLERHEAPHQLRNLGSSFYHTELERDAAIEQEREIGGTFMNNSHNSQILRPMRLHAASQQQWLAREADDERRTDEDVARSLQDLYNSGAYSSSDMGETVRSDRPFPDSPFSVNSSPPRPVVRSLLDPYARQSNYIPPIQSMDPQQIIELGEDEDDNESLICFGDGNPGAVRLPSIRTNDEPFSYNHAGYVDSIGYVNDPGWPSYIPEGDLLGPEFQYLSERPVLDTTSISSISGIGNFNDGSSMAIVDSQGRVIQDLNDDFNVGWPLPQSYKPEIHRYIDHIRADPTKSLEEIKTLMENIRPDMEIPPEDREGTPPEMTYPLMEHQKLGLAWLKSMEEGSNKGGILADDMGLGKTIQALALIVSRKSTDEARKTTLILTPVALLKQWEREIKVKLKPEHGLKVCIHHGTSKRSKSFADLAKFDVVLTTFGTVGNEYKKKLRWESEAKEGSPTGLFFLGEECKWYRVIIDEAQCIKNKDTQYAKGCCAIDAEYRLCLSGTPMQNSCDELFSLIRFLKIKPYNEWPEFSRNFSKPLKGKNEYSISQAIRKLQALMKAILLRRTKSSMIDGKPILTLPDKTVEMVHAVFSPDELAFYQALQDKSVLVFNKYLRANTVGRNYSNILVLLLRLRQACCHPHLIRDAEMSNNEPLDEKMIKLAKELPLDTVARLKDPEAFECPICLDAAENPSIIVPCGHAFCSECLVRLHNQHAESNLQQGKEDNNGVRCPGCRGEFSMERVIDLLAFRKVHQPETLASGKEGEDLVDDDLIFDTDDSEDEEEDESDDQTLGGFVVADDDEQIADGSNTSETAAPQKTAKKSQKDSAKKDTKGKGKAKEKAPPRTLAEVRKDAMRNAKSKKQYMKHLQKRWISSAKIDKCVEILEGVERRDPTEKTIVFSQFTSLLDLIEVPINQKSWQYRRYDGGMSSTSRNQALMDFTDKPEVNIILVSLKAGNSGLNLVAASQVIILDPFYNPFIESQAIDRAHRIGQQRQVFVHRLIVEGTVEDRVLALQDKKRKLIEGALDENASKGIGRLNARDLGFLFGISS